MVQGAVKRMNAEKEGPTISYETFVEELDEGDSFTTSLIDVLVKEMAERRTRPNPVDRRLISEKTAKSLRMQAAPLHVYRGGQAGVRERHTRRSIPILPPRSYSTFHDILSESDGEEEYGTVVNPPGPIEGARINTDLYDAYFPSTYDLPGSISRRADSGVAPPASPPPAGPAEPSGAPWVLNSPRAQSPPSGRSIWHSGASGSGSSLSRQSSVRRPYRTRTMDFSEFTSRRRSAIRNNNAQEDGPRADSSADVGGRLSAFGMRRSPDSTLPEGLHTYGILPWSSTRRRSLPSSSGSTGGNAPSSSIAVEEPTSTAPTSRSPSSSQLWHTLTSAPTPAPVEPAAVAMSVFAAGSVDGDHERPQVVAPRLRRGGLRPPESLLTHQQQTGPHDMASVDAAGPPPLDHSNLAPSSESPAVESR
ncbi:hypothetical protein C8Q79DRAFT_943959 [Trametes meyenii]|nr:hypothetical protein C8Q79DRAFT_943959 [Trametes meyenii]